MVNKMEELTQVNYKLNKNQVISIVMCAIKQKEINSFITIVP